MVPSGSEAQVRTTHGWLIGFFQWILWLFRRGGGSEPARDTQDSVSNKISALDPVNGNAEAMETSHQSSHSSAANATSHDQHVELSGGSRATDQPKPLASEGLKSRNEEAVQTKHVQAFLERLPEIQRQLLEADTAPGRALAEFMAKLMPTKMQLRAPLRALRDDYKAMNEMGVHRASKRPESRIVPVVIVLGFIALEAFINGTFLAAGSEGGLIGGWVTALGISFFNVVLLGFMFGAMALRELSHHRLYRKLLGTLALCAVLAVAYSSNLLVAHYRDALGGSDPDNAGEAALANWLTNPVNPLKVSGVQSLWLLGIGIAFTIMGLVDGYLFEDPYPGYGQFYIEHARRQADYQSLFQNSFDELRDLEQKQDSRLAELADEINKRLNDYLLLKARYASKPDDPDFAAWKRIEEGFPEARVNAVLSELKDKRGKMLDEYTSAMRDLETLDPTH